MTPALYSFSEIRGQTMRAGKQSGPKLRGATHREKNERQVGFPAPGASFSTPCCFEAPRSILYSRLVRTRIVKKSDLHLRSAVGADARRGLAVRAPLVLGQAAEPGPEAAARLRLGRQRPGLGIP